MTDPQTDPDSTSQSKSVLGDIQSPRLMWFKAFLFVGLGILAAGVLILRHPGIIELGLLSIAIWAFCRSYYFAFYVIEHYIDSSYKFDGLFSVVRYFLGRSRDRDSQSDERNS